MTNGTRRGWVITALRRFWITVFCAFLFQRQFLCQFVGARNQFVLHWRRSDAVAITLAVLFLAGALSLAYGALTLLGRKGRWARDLGFLALTAFYLKVALLEVAFRSSAIPAAWSKSLNLIVLAVVILFVFRPKPLMRMIDGACLILSPIVLLYVVPLFLTPTVPSCGGTQEEAVGSAEGPTTVRSRPVKKVIVILFDAMSYHRTFLDGLSPDVFPGLTRASDESVVFHQAYSPANWTEPSVVGLLSGGVGQYGLEGAIPVLSADGEASAVRDLPSIFTDSKERGYRTYLYGIGPPYAALFERGLDDCQSKYSGSVKLFGQDLFGVSRAVLAGSLHGRVGRFWPALDRFWTLAARNQAAQLQEWIHRMTVQRIRERGDVVGFSHYMIPHYPYVFDRDGVLSEERLAEGNYTKNLHFVDTVIGQLVDEIRASLDYDQTLFIILADHTFRSDPALRPQQGAGQEAYDEYCHVPLLVHLPGQHRRMDIRTPFSTAFLRQVLADCLDKGTDLDEFVRRCGGFKRSDVRCAVDRRYAW
ncbi:MAG: sulfatase-like hydrolase/transferase [Kiritimatiellae bacterium]|nr:sulfatase-like hydrolase/transferase [Kiritimatiellia bacterium]